MLTTGAAHLSTPAHAGQHWLQRQGWTRHSRILGKPAAGDASAHCLLTPRHMGLPLQTTMHSNALLKTSTTQQETMRCAVMCMIASVVQAGKPAGTASPGMGAAKSGAKPLSLLRPSAGSPPKGFSSCKLPLLCLCMHLFPSGATGTCGIAVAGSCCSALVRGQAAAVPWPTAACCGAPATGSFTMTLLLELGYEAASTCTHPSP